MTYTAMTEVGRQFAVDLHPGTMTERVLVVWIQSSTIPQILVKLHWEIN